MLPRTGCVVASAFHTHIKNFGIVLLLWFDNVIATQRQTVSFDTYAIQRTGKWTILSQLARESVWNSSETDRYSFRGTGHRCDARQHTRVCSDLRGRVKFVGVSDLISGEMVQNR